MRRIVCLLAVALVLPNCAPDDVTRTVEVRGLEETAAGGGNPSPQAVAETAKPAKGQLTEVDLQRVFEMQGDGTMLLVDVRPPVFYGMGHIPGAINLPKRYFETSFPEKREELDAAVEAGKVIVLYCTNRQCRDGYLVGKDLARLGYSTSLYKGGWEEWKAAGL